MGGFVVVMILLKNLLECFDRLSMNGKTPSISTIAPFVLRLSKDERWVFQQNRLLCLTPQNPKILPSDKETPRYEAG